MKKKSNPARKLPLESAPKAGGRKALTSGCQTSEGTEASAPQSPSSSKYREYAQATYNFEMKMLNVLHAKQHSALSHHAPRVVARPPPSPKPQLLPVIKGGAPRVTKAPARKKLLLLSPVLSRLK